MHEFSIASEIVRAVLDTAEKNNGKKVLSIQLEVGELTHLSRDQVGFWIRELFKGSVAEDAEVKIKTIKARIHCRACGYKGGIGSGPEDSFRQLAFQPCPRCNSFEFKIERGRECILRKIQALK